MNKERRKKESDLFCEISQCCRKPDLTSEDEEKPLLLKAELDDIFLRRTQDAFIRSRGKWMKEGEKNITYFSKLEKKGQENKLIGS